ncbi:hypothetical protein ACFUAG_01880 [Streptomyces sp. NPDC057193]|uniref:hypothetical protein n=1 Tax=unclassified Streptomyces TaxID=2593676 RepID=UPI000938A3EE|nr:hypothetical protein [Streptomyces sp. CB02261]OKJ68062.1 hypothetical protein AMK29_08495 [Streptomyces sp. CB02261]
MATPERAEHTGDHVSMSDLLASCAAARTLSTPPRNRPEQAAGDGRETPAETRDVRDEAA